MAAFNQTNATKVLLVSSCQPARKHKLESTQAHARMSVQLFRLRCNTVAIPHVMALQDANFEACELLAKLNDKVEPPVNQVTGKARSCGERQTCHAASPLRGLLLFVARKLGTRSAPLCTQGDLLEISFQPDLPASRPVMSLGPPVITVYMRRPESLPGPATASP